MILLSYYYGTQKCLNDFEYIWNDVWTKNEIVSRKTIRLAVIYILLWVYLWLW